LVVASDFEGVFTFSAAVCDWATSEKGIESEFQIIIRRVVADFQITIAIAGPGS
jgi:hypothetical protein